MTFLDDNYNYKHFSLCSTILVRISVDSRKFIRREFHVIELLVTTCKRSKSISGVIFLFTIYGTNTDYLTSDLISFIITTHFYCYIRFYSYSITLLCSLFRIIKRLGKFYLIMSEYICRFSWAIYESKKCVKNDKFYIKNY